jgi:hypothetical protein
LIEDEVDNMCIDNICNTLYISHQTADLAHLKQIYVYIWQAIHYSDVSDYSIQVVDKVKELILRFFNERKITYPTHLKEFVTRRLQTWINNAYLAKEYIEEGVYYQSRK